jgi:peptidoglycan/xylan/chitin deacetylase (PgdA/CDA1 family)
MFDLTLSFDNGPEPEVTPGVLDELAARDIRATFFLLGRKLVLPGHRAAPSRAHAEGHWIGNHTWTHGTPLGTRPGAETAEAEVTRTQDLLGPLAHPDKLFRPHGGGRIGPQLLSPEVAGLLRAGGYTCVLWTSVPGDYRDPDGWVEPALADCASRPWTVMVLHDLPNGAMAHLGRFLDAARDAGARFRQDFPADCIPILRGEARAGLEGLVTPG